jgi:hypothetical protein
MTAKARLLMMNNYATLMEEAKQRIGWLNVLLSGKIPLPNAATQEFGFLQLRIICELIALGRVDGFDQDEAQYQSDERAVIASSLLAS